jgi:hypothetical protein
MASARPASQRSCSQQETPDGQFCFVIPSAIDDCDGVPSISQHSLQYASQVRHAGLACISDDKHKDHNTQSEEEEGDVEMSNSSEGEEDEEELEKREVESAAKFRTQRKRVQERFQFIC